MPTFVSIGAHQSQNILATFDLLSSNVEEKTNDDDDDDVDDDDFLLMEENSSLIEACFPSSLVLFAVLLMDVLFRLPNDAILSYKPRLMEALVDPDKPAHRYTALNIFIRMNEEAILDHVIDDEVRQLIPARLEDDDVYVALLAAGSGLLPVNDGISSYDRIRPRLPSILAKVTQEWPEPRAVTVFLQDMINFDLHTRLLPPHMMKLVEIMQHYQVRLGNGLSFCLRLMMMMMSAVLSHFALAFANHMQEVYDGFDHFLATFLKVLAAMP